MTGRERLVAVARGGEVEGIASLARAGSGVQADGFFGALEQLRPGADEAQLLTVRSPLGRFLDFGTDIYRLLDSNPAEGERQIQEQVDQVRQEFMKGMSLAVDGFMYLVDGAYPQVSSPMQYGGHFLEVDRMLLDEVSGSTLNVVWVCGDDEPYLDFVCDLPGHVFGWESQSGVSVSEFRPMRPGAFVGEFENADVKVMTGSPCRGRLETSVL